MNYIGSKFSLSDFLYENITQNISGNLAEMLFCDIFAGTGAVSKIFKNKVAKIITNDTEFYSFVLCKNYIQNCEKLENLSEFIEILNNLDGIKGKIFKNYALGSGSNRQYFSDENAQKIDAIRQKIEQFRQENKIDEKIYYFLLCSLLESSDKVANTASVYGAFLKHLKKSAQKHFVLSPANFEICGVKSEIYNENANDLIKKISGDILYLDPPYNHRQYGANYHILNSIALYDDFLPSGKTGLRNYYKSKWCQKNAVFDEFFDLIKWAKFRYIFLSYNNEGILSPNEIKEIFTKFGKYKVFRKTYGRFKADSNRFNKATQTTEYLHFCEKS